MQRPTMVLASQPTTECRRERCARWVPSVQACADVATANALVTIAKSYEMPEESGFLSDFFDGMSVKDSYQPIMVDIVVDGTEGNGHASG